MQEEREEGYEVRRDDERGTEGKGAKMEILGKIQEEVEVQIILEKEREKLVEKDGEGAVIDDIFSNIY